MSDWAIDWRGNTWTSDDLTGTHAAVVAELLGIAPSWDWFDPSDLHPAMGPLQVIVLIAAFAIVADNVFGDAARRAVFAAIERCSVDELTGAVRVGV